MENIFLALQNVASFQTIVLILVGVVAGIVAGSIPGFTVTMGVALTLPFSFGMSPLDGVALMVGVVIGGGSGGLLPAVMLGIPGTPESMATTFDGYPMARKGQPGKALATGLFASGTGALISGAILVFLAPTLAELATAFGPWAFSSLALLALCAIAGLVGDSLIKGLISGLLGVVFALVGIDLLTGAERFTFGFTQLQGGFNFLPVLIGLFAFSQLLEAVRNPSEARVLDEAQNVRYPLSRAAVEIGRKSPLNLIRSSLIGTLVGILPGAGGSVANVLSYDIAKKVSRRKGGFGTGVQDGIIASEGANSSTIGGSLVPTLAFGIPGSSTTAMMLGALIIHGVQPGPLFMSQQPVLGYGIFLSVFIAAIFMLVVQSQGIKLFLMVNRIPQYHLVPGILVLCALGSFAINNRIFDVWILLLFGVLGYWMRENGFPLAPFILGLILSPLLETNMRQAISVNPSWLAFITKPLSGALLALAVLSLAYGIYSQVMTSKTKTEDADKAIERAAGR